MSTRTIGAIALRPTGNVQGGHYFFSLQTGRRVVRNRWTEVPMPIDVIKRVNAMAENITLNKLVFGDRENVEVDDEFSDSELEDDTPSTDSESSGSSASGSDSEGDDEDDHGEQRQEDEDGDDESHDESRSSPPGQEENNESRRVRLAPEVKQEREMVVVNTEPQPEIGEEQHVDGDTNLEDDSEDQPEDADDADIGGVSLDEQMNHRYGQRTGAHNLRARRKPRYDLSLIAQASNQAIVPRFDVSRLAALSPSLEPLLGVVLTQYGVKKGLKLFGAQGDDEVRKEMQQLHDRKVMRPKSGPALTATERIDALQYLMFLQQKRDGTIKGRGCADGRKQRSHIGKSEASSPTISTEAVFLIITIAAKEKGM